jgi:hypothetical protein
LRVIDESGEDYFDETGGDYLYPANLFVPIEEPCGGESSLHRQSS